MRNTILTVSLLACLFITACTDRPEDHILSDSKQRTTIKNELKAKQQLLPDGNLFDILKDKEISKKEKEALQFLYAYMPIGDITDYPGTYHLENVRIALRAKEEMPWGASIPELEFNHFVLPARVNNESLDRFRSTYYEELKARVQNLSLADAALEVNHWCHEHVNYKGSDSRTSAPMSTIKTSWGRCGEESTLLVSALRTVGIPARQVYTPRWAHTDDNHAWVEAYVDGGWHFMGACEPEPVLDLGWFNEPASRALLLHTRVFGDYQGPEEVISRNPCYTEINIIGNYAKSVTNTITVLDGNMEPMVGTPVEFKIYNYAEYCTVATKLTDSNGQAQLTTGLGTIMVYAGKDGQYGFKVINTNETNEITIVASNREGVHGLLNYNIIAPEPNAVIPEVSTEARAENDRRVAQEDSLRNAYIQQCQTAQEQLNAATGNKSLGAIYGKTWGNYQTIADFAKEAEAKGKLTQAVMLLQSLSDKDLRDVSLDVLNDQLEGWTSDNRYVYGPRVSNEPLVPYRKELSQFFSEADRKAFQGQPEQLVEWVKNNIKIDDELNPQRIPMTPTGVLKARIADHHSRDIFFVAMARSNGIPAQINPINGNVQYQVQENWVNVNFDAEAPKATSIGYLDIQYKPTESNPDPKYYTHFSIKKFDGKDFNLLAYDAQDPGIDDGMNLSSFANLPLESGYYILTSGTRLSNGNVLSNSEFFNIKEGDTTHVNLILREPNDGLKLLGHVDAQFTDLLSGEAKNLDAAGQNGYVLAFLDQGSEPTTHAMQDFISSSNRFNKMGCPLYFLFADAKTYEQFQTKAFTDLPETVVYGYYTPDMKKAVFKDLKVKGNQLPVFVIVNKDHEAYYLSQGYNIGLTLQLIKVLKAL